jgi:hypothetical protein
MADSILRIPPSKACQSRERRSACSVQTLTYSDFLGGLR